MTRGRIIMTTLLIVGAINLGQGLYLPAKAAFAQYLLRDAWQRGASARPDAQPERPWPWADTYPLARLTGDAVPGELFILAGGSGRTLAFGPGHIARTALPGAPGNSVIAGHRDTHFSFLADLALGDRLVLDTRAGERQVFEVDGLEVVDARRAAVAIDSDEPRLTLVTCYPFDAIEPGGPLRYVVSMRAPN